MDDAGLVAPTWPLPFGRGLSTADARTVTAELARAGTVAPPTGVIGIGMAGPTLLAYSTGSQRERLMRPMLRGEESWCQLFSEPGAGSDLPSLTTRADRFDDGWSVTGQKVWSSGAHLARRGLLLARTDLDSTGRPGLTFFVIDMDQPGVDVRPLRTMTGEAPFCEVFLDGARVDDRDVVGAVGDGWRVARTTLFAERHSAADRVARGLVHVASGAPAGQLDRRVGDVLDTRVQRPRFGGSAIPAAALIDLAREYDLAADPLVRQGVARYWSLITLQRLTRARARDSASAAAVIKLGLSRVCRTSRDLSLSVLGASAMLAGTDAPDGGEIVSVGLSSPGVSIGAGTDEIQRNTIAERTLGLPREPRGG